MTFNTLEGVAFWTDVSNFRKVQLFLKERKFVNATDWPIEMKEKLGERFDDTLVYEEEGRGLYRCSFHRIHQDGPCFEFNYWENKLTPEQKSRDPMKQIVLDIYNLLKPIRVTNYNLDEIVLD